MNKFIVNQSIIFTFCIVMNSNFYAQWENPVALNTIPFWGIYLCENNAKSLVTGGDSVHIVFVREYGFPTVYYIRSTNNGNNWDSIRQLSVNNDIFIRKPSIAISGSTLHIVWYGGQDSKIFYDRSTDGGNSWDTARVIDNDINESKHTAVSVQGSNVYVVWSDRRSGFFQIYLKYSSNGGNTWNSAVRVSNETSDCELPSMCILNSTVHVVWSMHYDNDKIRYSRTTNNGINWSSVTNPNDYPSSSDRPCIVTTGSVIRVVWERGNLQGIYTDYSTDNGLNWNIDRILTDSLSSARIASLFSDGTVLHLVWRQEPFYNPFYKCSYDGGNSWGGVIQLFSANGGTSNELGAPCVGVSGNVLHVIWASYYSIIYSLFYRRNLTGNVNGIEPISTQNPGEFSLKQNYPNPFNPITHIKFNISEAGNTQLKVYDGLGREVNTLVNENLQKGEYEVEWDGANHASGVYFYRLTSGDYSEMKKMVLIK